MGYIMKTILIGLLTFICSFIAIGAVVKDIKQSTKVIVLDETNSAYLNAQVDARTTELAIMQLRLLDPSKPRYLYINSPGGEVITGMRLVNYLQSSEGKGVICIANTAISMAFVALQACETRLVTENAILMSHGLSSSASGSIKTIESDLKFSKKLEYLLHRIQSSRIGITIQQLIQHQDPDWWIVGYEEAIKTNVTDGVAQVSCAPSIAKPERIKQTEMEVMILKCPL